MACFQKVQNTPGDSLYKGIKPLWARQIPYTVVKFVAFEQFVSMFYANVFTKPKSEYGKGT